MRLERKHLVQSIYDYVLKDSGLIIGSPGVGKSYIIKEKLIRLFEENEISYLYFPIEHLGDGSEVDLKKELEYENTFIDSIVEWCNVDESQRIIIFDSFDSARDEKKRRNFLNIFQDIVENFDTRVNLIVVVRCFDAKKSIDLINLFDNERDDKTKNIYQSDFECRHFIIPPLDDNDIEEAKTQISGLENILGKASKEFIKILRVPFNLWLLEKILKTDSHAIDLSYIKSEVQLLGLFWKKRIKDRQKTFEKESFLKSYTYLMVKQKRMLVKISDDIEPEELKIYEDLLSDEILSKVGINENKLSYSHNIFFDFAVNMLLMDDDEKEMEKFLLEDFSRPLFLRPSLVYFFTRLWYEESEIFWKIFWYLLASKESQLNLFARLIPTSVIINDLTSIQEIKPLLKKIELNDETAKEATKRILQTFKVITNKKYEVWSTILLKFSEHISEVYLWELASNNFDMYKAIKNKTINEIIFNISKVSIAIFSWLWERRKKNKNWFDNINARLCVPIIMKTYSSNPVESAIILRKAISVIEEENFPIDYFFMISNEIENLWNIDTEFCAIFYETVFGTEVNEDTPTNMGTPILPMKSNRRQDFHSCHYSLAEKFKGFLDTSPIEAAKVSIKIANKFIINKHVIPYLKKDETLESKKKELLFRGKSCSYILDMSYVWSSSSYEENYNDELKILKKFLDNLLELFKGENKDKVLDIITEYTEVAYLWGKLLIIGSKNPKLLFHDLYELVRNDSILFEDETVYHAGEFLKNTHNIISNNQIEEIEKIIHNYSVELSDDKFLEKRKTKLLNCLPHDKLSERSLNMITLVEGSGRSIDNKPLVTFSSGFSEVPEYDRWKDFGVDMEKEENQELIKLNDRLNDFVLQWQNKKLEDKDIEIKSKLIYSIYNEVKNKQDLDETVSQSVWSKLAEATKILLENIARLSDEQYKDMKEIILHCSTEKFPVSHSEDNNDYKFPSWSPDPRNEAALILPWLFANKSESDLLEAISKLSFDPVPSVRFLVVRNLWRISEKSSKDFWGIIDKLIPTETNTVVLASILQSLSHALHRDQNKSSERLLKIIPRGIKSDEDSEFFRDSTALLVRMIIKYENKSAERLLSSYFNTPLENSKIFKDITFQVLTAIEPKLLNGEDEKIFNNAVILLKDIISKADKGIDELTKSHENIQAQHQEIFHNIYGVIHETIMRIYFHADIPDRKFKRNKPVIGDELRNVYYKKTLPLLSDIIKIISSVGKKILFAPTAHYFMQYLNGILKYDPQNVLHMAYIVADSSKDYNYNLDSMAVREVVKLVDKVIADYRDKFQKNENLKDLVGLLDIFADTGWPEALDLVWRLDEIYK
ncbi:MAG: ATP-binding protein [Ignavibacteria bacterium]|jgi:hypothetical protein